MWVCCCCSWSYFVSFPASFPPLVLNIVLCLFPSIWAHKQVSLSLFLGVVERCCCERRRCIRLAHCVNPPDGTVCLEGAPRSKNHPGAYNGSKQAGRQASKWWRTHRPTDQQTPMTVNDKQQKKKRKMAAATAAVDFTSSHQPYGVFPPSLPSLSLCTPFLLLLLLSTSSS